jgi:hypothetical protein
MDVDAIHPLMTHWCDLDRVYLTSEYARWVGNEPGSSFWPWESDNPELRELWERLTHPANLPALEDWARGVDSFNDFARAFVDGYTCR